MNKLFHKRWLVVARVLLLTVLISCPSQMMADDGWVLVYQDVDGKTVEIPMVNVGSLVAVDDAYDFTILSTTGSVLAEGVMKVSFKDSSLTGIGQVLLRGSMISQSVSDKLTLIGLFGDVLIYDASGKQKAKVTAMGGETVVNIAQLTAGVYVVKCGKQTFKFIKK